ncbi:MAG TPA: GMC family oxidoreductase [Byssovorax sp.]
MSAAIVGNASLTEFDVLVIGSGGGGGTISHMLTKLGLTVLVLEAGPNRFIGLDDPDNLPSSTFSNDELKLSERNFIYPSLLTDPRTWRTSDSGTAVIADVNALPKTVGGGAVHADLKMPRFQPDDFHLGTLIQDKQGAAFADWPVDYDMLEPFYAYVERTIGVQGLMGSDPYAGPRSTDYPMPPGVGMYCALLVAAGAEKIGLNPFPYPTAVNSRVYDGRPACVDCGYCSGYACPSNAKGSPPVTTLRRALLTGKCQLRPETRVAKLLLNGAKNEIVGVEAIGPDGARVTFKADRYVLAASPIESARLCLLSDPDGVGNSSGQVGRNLMFHLQTEAAGIFEERVHGHRGRTVTHGFSDFRGKPNDPDHPLGGIVEISGSEFPIEEASRYVGILKMLGSFDGKMLKRLLRQSPGRDRIVALALQAEDAPQSKNRADLDPRVRDVDGLPVARVTYENHAFELAARDFYSPKLVQLLGASGCKYALVSPKDPIPASAHIMGTLRFGSDKATSVCDENGKFHDVGNLFASDGSLFPTSSGFNPTLTIMALATRVGAAMVNPDSPERGLD